MKAIFEVGSTSIQSLPNSEMRQKKVPCETKDVMLNTYPYGSQDKNVYWRI